jgi:hypothetical protein
MLHGMQPSRGRKTAHAAEPSGGSLSHGPRTELRPSAALARRGAVLVSAADAKRHNSAGLDLCGASISRRRTAATQHQQRSLTGRCWKGRRITHIVHGLRLLLRAALALLWRCPPRTDRSVSGRAEAAGATCA